MSSQSERTGIASEILLGFLCSGGRRRRSTSANSANQRWRGNRSHSIAEVFSTLTGNPLVRISAEDASSALEKLAANLDFIDVGAKEVLLALKQAGKLGVRGGRVHDYVHALAADKSGADELLTLDANDFVGLTVKAKIEVL